MSKKWHAMMTDTLELVLDMEVEISLDFRLD